MQSIETSNGIKSETPRVITDTEIFDPGFRDRLKAIFLSLGLYFSDFEIDFYQPVITAFIKEMYEDLFS